MYTRAISIGENAVGPSNSMVVELRDGWASLLKRQVSDEAFPTETLPVIVVRISVCLGYEVMYKAVMVIRRYSPLSHKLAFAWL